MKADLTDAERRNLLLALRKAIEWEKSMASAYYVEYPKVYTGSEEMVVPKEFRPIVARCLRRVKAFNRLIVKLS